MFARVFSRPLEPERLDTSSPTAVLDEFDTLTAKKRQELEERLSEWSKAKEGPSPEERARAYLDEVSLLFDKQSPTADADAIADADTVEEIVTSESSTDATPGNPEGVDMYEELIGMYEKKIDELQKKNADLTAQLQTTAGLSTAIEEVKASVTESVAVKRSISSGISSTHDSDADSNCPIEEDSEESSSSRPYFWDDEPSDIEEDDAEENVPVEEGIGTGKAAPPPLTHSPVPLLPLKPEPLIVKMRIGHKSVPFRGHIGFEENAESGTHTEFRSDIGYDEWRALVLHCAVAGKSEAEDEKAAEDSGTSAMAIRCDEELQQKNDIIVCIDSRIFAIVDEKCFEEMTGFCKENAVDSVICQLGDCSPEVPRISEVICFENNCLNVYCDDWHSLQMDKFPVQLKLVETSKEKDTKQVVATHFISADATGKHQPYARTELHTPVPTTHQKKDSALTQLSDALVSDDLVLDDATIGSTLATESRVEVPRMSSLSAKHAMSAMKVMSLVSASARALAPMKSVSSPARSRSCSLPHSEELESDDVGSDNSDESDSDDDKVVSEEKDDAIVKCCEEQTEIEVVAMAPMASAKNFGLIAVVKGLRMDSSFAVSIASANEFGESVWSEPCFEPSHSSAATVLRPQRSLPKPRAFDRNLLVVVLAAPKPRAGVKWGLAGRSHRRLGSSVCEQLVAFQYMYEDFAVCIVDRTKFQPLALETVTSKSKASSSRRKGKLKRSRSKTEAMLGLSFDCFEFFLVTFTKGSSRKKWKNLAAESENLLGPRRIFVPKPEEWMGWTVPSSKNVLFVDLYTTTLTTLFATGPPTTDQLKKRFSTFAHFWRTTLQSYKLPVTLAPRFFSAFIEHLKALSPESVEPIRQLLKQTRVSTRNLSLKMGWLLTACHLAPESRRVEVAVSYLLANLRRCGSAREVCTLLREAMGSDKQFGLGFLKQRMATEVLKKQSFELLSMLNLLTVLQPGSNWLTHCRSIKKKESLRDFMKSLAPVIEAELVVLGLTHAGAVDAKSDDVTEVRKVEEPVLEVSDSNNWTLEALTKTMCNRKTDTSGLARAKRKTAAIDWALSLSAEMHFAHLGERFRPIEQLAVHYYVTDTDSEEVATVSFAVGSSQTPDKSASVTSMSSVECESECKSGSESEDGGDNMLSDIDFLRSMAEDYGAKGKKKKAAAAKKKQKAAAGKKKKRKSKELLFGSDMTASLLDVSRLIVEDCTSSRSQIKAEEECDSGSILRGDRKSQAAVCRVQELCGVLAAVSVPKALSECLHQFEEPLMDFFAQRNRDGCALFVETMAANIPVKKESTADGRGAEPCDRNHVYALSFLRKTVEKFVACTVSMDANVRNVLQFFEEKSPELVVDAIGVAIVRNPVLQADDWCLQWLLRHPFGFGQALGKLDVFKEAVAAMCERRLEGGESPDEVLRQLSATLFLRQESEDVIFIPETLPTDIRERIELLRGMESNDAIVVAMKRLVIESTDWKSAVEGDTDAVAHLCEVCGETDEDTCHSLLQRALSGFLLSEDESTRMLETVIRKCATREFALVTKLVATLLASGRQLGDSLRELVAELCAPFHRRFLDLVRSLNEDTCDLTTLAELTENVGDENALRYLHMRFVQSAGELPSELDIDDICEVLCV